MKYDSVIIVFLCCITFVCALAISTYLVVNEHPWFAAFVLLLATSVRARWGDDKEDKKAKED